MLRPRRESDVRSLFGATPEQIRLKQYEDQMAFLNAQQSGFGKAGAALGLGLASLFGGKSPEIQQAEQRQETVRGIDELGAMAEAEARQRGMAPMSMAEPDVLAREANRLESVSAAFRNLGQDTGELDNEVLRLRVEADKATRARGLDDLRIKNTQLQIQRGEFDLRADKEDRPIIRKSRQLQFEIAGLDKQIKKGSIADEKEQKEKLTRVRKNTVSFFDDIKNDPSAAVYSRLVKDEIIAPANAIKGWQDAKQTGIDVTEIGAYTNSQGQEIIGAIDKKNGQLYQLTDAGWMVIPSEGWTQGPPSTGGAASAIKQGRSISGQVKKDYDTQFQSLVDTGIFLDTEQEVLIQQNTGIEDITSKEGKQELYRRAEQIFANTPGITEREALERALAGDRVTTPSTPTQAPSNKPDLSKVTAK
jgi:hypothetical protein